MTYAGGHDIDHDEEPGRSRWPCAAAAAGRGPGGDVSLIGRYRSAPERLTRCFLWVAVVEGFEAIDMTSRGNMQRPACARTRCAEGGPHKRSQCSHWRDC